MRERLSSDVRASTLTTLLFDDGPLFLTDCFIDLDPTVDQIVSKTLLGIEQVRQFGITPRVALLSHSNFGSSNAPSARKMRQASEILRERLPDVEIDGEMHSLTALDSAESSAVSECISPSISTSGSRSRKISLA